MIKIVQIVGIFLLEFLGQLTPDEENSCTNKVLFLFYEQDEYLSIKDIANRVPYSEKQVVRVVRNLFKQGNKS